MSARKPSKQMSAVQARAVGRAAGKRATLRLKAHEWAFEIPCPRTNGRLFALACAGATQNLRFELMKAEQKKFGPGTDEKVWFNFEAGWVEGIVETFLKIHDAQEQKRGTEDDPLEDNDEEPDGMHEHYIPPPVAKDDMMFG